MIPSANPTNKRRPPLTQDQKDTIYKLYTRDSATWTMKALAFAFNTSPSVIHRTVHQEAYARGLPLAIK